MATYSNFRSSNQIEVERQELRDARKKVLEKAKEDYEKSERRRERARQAGEGTWMLSSVTERIEKEQKALEKVKEKRKKKDKRKKKMKKHKKEKKKRRQSSSSSDTESSDEEASWVEKGSGKEPSRPVSGPSLQRDSWMESPLVTDIIPTVTRAELREKKRGEEDKKKEEAAKLVEQPGKHTRELNPYWRDGGTGLPEKKPAQTDTPPATSASMAGDGGLSWLRKAYQRCQQQAKQEGRSLEDVAAERYGSLEKLTLMIREAEDSSGCGCRRPGSQHPRPRRSSHSPDRGRKTFGGEDNESDRDQHDKHAWKRDRERTERESDVRGNERRDRENSDRRSKERDHRNRDWRDTKRSDSSRDRADRQERRRFIRPNGDSDGDDKTPRSQTRTFMKPSGDDRPSESTSSVSSLKGRFARPNDSDDDDKGFADYHRQTKSRSETQQKPSGGGGGWRKKPPPPSGKGDSAKKESGDGRRKRLPSASSRSESDSSSSGSESEAEDDGRKGGRKEEEPVPVVQMLSEDEMNSLGAKILRAELMGDEDLARQLKARLEQAQKAKENASKTGSEVKANPGGRGEGEEESVVVLTRTGRDGLVRPLPDQEFDREQGGKKRRKQKNVATHGRDGKRARYFDDDDRHDLKTLVEMEKLGTAEDQNAMFSRLAGRSTERTDDDFQVDDMFVSKAARQQSGARNEEKERSKAIFEHRKVSAAMEKCQFCFNSVPKHLLIAIGSKAYLSLPAHRSLTPGHCLIVPMQHVSAATALDEDVWQEMQAFRKQLVQMFSSQDQDIVFMETSMHQRHFPHTVLECIPLDREVGDLAPIYFKKAMQDAGPEWSNNKKVVDLSRKDIRHSVPKGFAYFSVDFGLQGGFAHVIEDEKTFPSYFGREIVGGMIDAEPGLWRKPHREGFEDQRRKVLEFEKWWKPFDFTNA